MTAPAEDDRTLVLQRTLDAPRETLYRCWTDPDLMKQWFVPRPWTITRVEQDLRPGGRSLIVMADPDGNEHPNPGVYLEIVPNEKIAFTDAFGEDWTPVETPFMTAVVTFEDAGEGRTLYTAVARHFTAEGRKQHEAMGFREGWGTCADQLEELAKTL